MGGRVDRVCQVCGSNVGFTRSDDGFFYCGYCNSQADDIFDTGIDEEQYFNLYSASCTRVRPSNTFRSEPVSQVKLTASQFLDHHDMSHHPKMEDTVDDDGLGPTGPSDFGSSQKILSYEDYYSEIRSRYVTGLQIMIQLQSQALVDHFNVSPLIIGLVGPLWLRFLSSTGILAGEWADLAVNDSEAQTQGEAEEFQPSDKSHTDPLNIHGKRVVYVWYRSLRSALPISCSLAISFLVCHLAREPILPCDIVRWTIEGKLPYFAAFGKIEKQLGSHSKACPISVSRMFRPIQAISSQKLESVAAEIAQKIGLELPPVNVYAIASRYIRELSLPLGELLPLACHISEWSMPSELYLSSNEARIPTRICVMSILIVAVRILFDINGYGVWESSLSKIGDTESKRNSNTTKNANEDSSSHKSEPTGTKSGVLDSRLSAVEVLQILEAKYDEIDDVHAYSCDLPSYLQYCKDVVFSGLHPSYEDIEEEKLLEEFWEFYQNNKGAGTSDRNKKSRDVAESRKKEVRKNRSDHSTCSTYQKTDDCSNCRLDQDGSSHFDPDSADQTSEESTKEKAIKQLKLDMEEKQFCYIRPRVRLKRKDYIHYARRRQDVLIYAVHADYYILLRSCAKVAQVETRVMHIAVLSLEKKLQWLEKEIESSLHFKPSLKGFCEFCKDDDLVQNGVANSNVQPSDSGL